MQFWCIRVGRSRPVACRRFPGLDPFGFCGFSHFATFTSNLVLFSHFFFFFRYVLLSALSCYLFPTESAVFEGIEDCPGYGWFGLSDSPDALGSCVHRLLIGMSVAFGFVAADFLDLLLPWL